MIAFAVICLVASSVVNNLRTVQVSVSPTGTVELLKDAQGDDMGGENYEESMAEVDAGGKIKDVSGRTGAGEDVDSADRMSGDTEKYLEKWDKARKDKLGTMFRGMMWSTLDDSSVPLPPGTIDGKFSVFTQAGDFPYLWIRDSTASFNHYFTTGLVTSKPHVGKVAQGLAMTLATLITKDPRCSVWKPSFECWDRNFELDSWGYFLRYLRNCETHGLPVVEDPIVKKAQDVLLEAVEEELDSRKNVKLLWSRNRPSDDMVGGGESESATKEIFHIPDNLFLAAELKNMGLRRSLSPEDHTRAQRLSDEIKNAVRENAIQDGRYCYEIDCTSFATQNKCSCIAMDDANLPNLLSLPYMAEGVFDTEIYLHTRKWILSTENPYYYKSESGDVAGLGSPHTGRRTVWPLGLLSQGVSTTDATEQARVIAMLMDTDAGTNLMHESFDVDSPSSFSRSWFDWPNSLFIELVDGCCHDLMVGIAPDAYEREPADPFHDWTTCGFQNGACLLSEHSQAGVDKVCVRYGSTFTDFSYKLVDAKLSSIPCGRESFADVPPLRGYSGYFPLPYYCAVAKPENCE